MKLSQLLGRLSTHKRMVSYCTAKAFSKKYLLATNIAISATLTGTADGMVQSVPKAKHKPEKWDKLRTTRMSICGVGFGAVAHYWYLFLDSKLVGNSLSMVLKKTFIDQLVLSPVMILLFFTSMNILERGNFMSLNSDLKTKARDLYIMDWIVYPPAQFINFRFLPTRFRVVYDNGISFCFDMYYSYVKHERE